MGDFLVKETKDFLRKRKNKELNPKEFVFRRVALGVFLSGRPNHRLDTTVSMFRNEKGDGMSVDWERLCSDPMITQTRDKENPENYGVVVLSVFDIQNHPIYELKIINDQKGYDCHCLVPGIPMSLKQLKQLKKGEYNLLSDEDKNFWASKLLSIREYLKDITYWIIPINNPKLNDPHTEFNYDEEFTERIKDFFLSRGHLIPT